MCVRVETASCTAAAHRAERTGKFSDPSDLPMVAYRQTHVSP